MQNWFFKKNLMMIQNKQHWYLLQTAKPNWCTGTVSRAGWCRVKGWAFIVPLTYDAGFQPTCEFQLNFLGQIFILGWLFPSLSCDLGPYFIYNFPLLPGYQFMFVQKTQLHKIWILANSERKTHLLSPLPTYHLKFFNFSYFSWLMTTVEDWLYAFEKKTC